MNTLSYRNASLKDLKKIVEIYNSTVASRMVTADTEPVSVASKQRWFEEHNTSTRPLWVIENENMEVLGWASYQSFYGRPAYNGTAELSIYLDAKQRGKGIGEQVLHYCMTQAPKYGIKVLLGFIFAHNEPSLKLFRKLGFEDWALLPDVATLDEQACSLCILGKRVA